MAATSSNTTVSWDFDFSQTTGYQGYKQRDLNICLIVFSTLFVFTRLYVRAFMTKGLGWDDAITVVAYLVLTVFSGLEIRTVGLGSGAHIDEIPAYYVPAFFNALTTQNLMYFWCVGLMRIAIIAFLLRLSKDVVGKFKVVVLCTGIVIIVQTLVGFLFRLLECKIISHLWEPPGLPDCMPKSQEAVMMWTHGAVGIAVDLVLLALPIWVVRSRMMNTSKAIRVALIFCVGIFVIVTGIVRLSIMIQTDFSVDTTFKMVTIAFWTDMEGHVGLWCACFPALQPVVRIVAFECGMRSKVDSYNRNYAGAQSAYGKSSKAGTNARESMFHPASKNGYLRNGSGFDGTVDDESDSNSRRGIVTEARASKDLELDNFDKEPRNGTIQCKTEVNIEVADVAHGDAANKIPKTPY